MRWAGQRTCSAGERRRLRAGGQQSQGERSVWGVRRQGYSEAHLCLQRRREAIAQRLGRHKSGHLAAAGRRGCREQWGGAPAAGTQRALAGAPHAAAGCGHSRGSHTPLTPALAQCSCPGEGTRHTCRKRVGVGVVERWWLRGAGRRQQRLAAAEARNRQRAAARRAPPVGTPGDPRPLPRARQLWVPKRRGAPGWLAASSRGYQSGPIRSSILCGAAGKQGRKKQRTMLRRRDAYKGQAGRGQGTRALQPLVTGAAALPPCMALGAGPAAAGPGMHPPGAAHTPGIVTRHEVRHDLHRSRGEAR